MKSMKRPRRIFSVFRVLPYQKFSKSAKALAGALNGRRIAKEDLPSVDRDKIVINWGATDFNTNVQMLNPPSIIKLASNKLKFFERIRDAGLSHHIPDFWTSQADIPADAYPIVCRTVLAGHSGEGIVIAESPAELVPAPLYVRYVKKKEEYRIHVGRYWDDYGPGTAIAIGVEGEWLPVIISVQQKKRRVDHENPNWQVRNHANGFIYAREGVTPPTEVLKAARECLMATGLNFGAVDVIWNEEKKVAKCLEINTAPGLEGQTVDEYAAFFGRFGKIESRPHVPAQHSSGGAALG